MRHRFVFLAILAWGSLAHALDLGAILNNSISNELKRQMDSGLSGIFRSVEEAVIGVNNSNLQIQGASNGQVVMYSLASCGYCNAARKYMVSQGISFIEKDVGRDATAKAEFRNIDEKGGVPLLIMGKHNVLTAAV